MEQNPMHPTFTFRQDENTEFAPAVLSHLAKHGFRRVTVDGICDLLVPSKTGESNGYLELKVSLKRGGYPASRRQWFFFRSMPTSVSKRYRIFIYDHLSETYCLATAEDIRPAIQGARPEDTWYLKLKKLRKLHLLAPKGAYEALIKWANDLE